MATCYLLFVKMKTKSWLFKDLKGDYSVNMIYWEKKKKNEWYAVFPTQLHGCLERLEKNKVMETSHHLKFGCEVLCTNLPSRKGEVKE